MREAIGFGPTDVLPASSDESQHQEMIGEGLDFVAQSGADVSGLVAAHRTAQDAVVHALTWGQDPANAFVQLDAANGARLDAALALLPTMEYIATDGYANPSNADLIDTVVVNFGMDADLRPLDFSPEQRQSILDAQRTRDDVLQNAMNWYRQDKLDAANDAFEQTLTGILTADQSAQLADIRQLLEERTADTTATETAALPNGGG